MSRSSGSSINSNSSFQQPLNNTNNNQQLYNLENENLEEDMRKAKESADLLKSVVLPLETEISSLKTKLDVSQKKINDLEKLIKNNNSLNNYIKSDSDEVEFYLSLNNELNNLRDDLNKSFNKFINAEIKNINLINEIFGLLNDEQKNVFLSNLQPKHLNLDNGDLTTERLDSDKFLEFINTVTVPQSMIDEMSLRFENLFKSFLAQNKNEKTKVELERIAESERQLREEIENTLNIKGQESKQQIEHLNREMSNLESIICELRGQYVNWQSQFQIQIDGLVKLNEDIQNEMTDVERKNDKLKADNLKLKSENKLLHNERSIVTQDFEKEFLMPQNTDDLQKLVNAYRSDMINLSVSNQILLKRNEQLSDKVKSSNIQDQLVISQSLESELERERKVRMEIDNENNFLKGQIKSLKEKTQQYVDNLRKNIKQLETDIEKSKNDNQELNNQIQALKRDSKNSISVQEDLVKMNQSLQIELEQIRASEQELRCQHEDDYDECATCKNTFSVTRRKHRCKHCCRIYCADCCNKTVHSGPNNRPNKVCDNCFRILDKDTSKSKSPNKN